WIGCVSSGLNEFNFQSGKFLHEVNENNNPNGINDTQILSAFQDKEGIVWIGSYSSGVYKLDKNKNFFGKVSVRYNNSNRLNDVDVNAFSEDLSGNLLIGTSIGGLNIYNQHTDKFIYLTHTDSKNSLINNSIASLYTDRKGIIWIGTSLGLDKFNPANNRFEHFVHDPQNANSLGYPYINSIISDNAGNLWLGLWGGGLDKLDLSSKFTHFKHDPKNSNSLCSNEVTYLFLDKKGIIWIGTNGGGLDSYNPVTNNFIHYKHDPQNKNSLSQDVIFSIYQFPNDDNNFLWIGTAGGGLNKLDIKTGRFIRYTEDDGLPNNQVYGILGDKNGNLWLSTNKGLSKFNPATKEFKNYDQSFGLQSNEFNQNAFFEDKNGEMFFGGVNGFNMFYPGNIKRNLYKPPIIFTSVKEFNKEVDLAKPIFLANKLILSYKNNVLTFTFAALSFTNPDNNQYAYKLEGFDKDWIDLGKNNNVTFTNLDPGEYVLRVKASNNDGVWNAKGASLILIITPPFWLTWWFKIVFTVCLVLLIFIIYKLQIKNIQNQNKKLEALVEERTNELQIKTKELIKFNKMQAEILEQLSKSEIELKELNAAKDKYFSILAHDLRSPFNSLVGFSDLLENEFENLEKEEIKKSAKNINLSAKKLLILLNNLLEWSLFQAGKMEFKPSQENLPQIVDDVVNVIQGNAMQKSISIQNEIEDNISVWADKFMLHSVFQNLISNSIKFTERGGSIKISATVNDCFVEISVSDTGIGINKEDINKIFDIKKSHSTKGTENESGSGLGLNLCKELIKKHGGEISVNSEKGMGTKFIFTLPKSGPNK
ncbi:MAG: ATP-binding protein, partial [Bacteroidetes bacterium]|nr:ATP-binding protein [Bacteroidota bacterium]